MNKPNLISGILSNEEAIKKFSTIIINNPAGKKAIRSELKSWFEKEKIDVVRKTSRSTQIINPVLASKKRSK